MRDGVGDFRFLNEPEFFETHQIEYKWLRTEGSMQELVEWIDGREISPFEDIRSLELVGRRADFQARDERRYRRELAVLALQRIYRGSLVRKRLRQEQQDRCCVLVQRWLRGVIARSLRDEMVRRRAAVLIQCMVRQAGARVALAILRRQRLEKLRLWVAVRMQSMWRRKIAARHI